MMSAKQQRWVSNNDPQGPQQHREAQESAQSFSRDTGRSPKHVGHSTVTVGARDIVLDAIKDRRVGQSFRRGATRNLQQSQIKGAN